MGKNGKVWWASWTLLMALLVALVSGASFYDRAGQPGSLPGESTPLMQAESLVRDFDLRYSRADFDRYLARWGSPRDLEIVTADAGATLAFRHSVVFALWLAPFMALAPANGFALANALLLASACGFAARTLERWLGPSAPLWIVGAAFGSVTFGYVFLATADVASLACSVVAFSLIARTALPPRHRQPEELYGGVGEAPAPLTRRWLAVGALLAVPTIREPLLTMVLPLAALASAPPRHRGRARGALLLGFSAVALAELGLRWWAAGGLGWGEGSSFRFTPETGYPEVDFAAIDWTENVRVLGAFHWEEAPRWSWGWDLGLWLWNLAYLVAGRHIGLLPYFAPALVFLLASRRGEHRSPLLWAACLWVPVLLAVHPFDLAGGGGALANRYFLPLYGALWMVVARPRAWWWPLVTAALAAPFLWSLWSAPWGHRSAAGGGQDGVASWVRRLPVETSQRRIPAGDEATVDGLWVRFLNQEAWAEVRRGSLAMEGDARVELLLAAGEALDVIRLEFGPEASSRLEVEGATVGERILLANGGIVFRLLPTGWPPRHPMWWTPRRQTLYHLSFRFVEAPVGTLRFRLLGERVAGGSPGVGAPD